MRSLTRVEAEERARLLQVTRYEIEVDLTGLLSGSRLRCVSRIVFTCREPGAESFVDCAATVESAMLNGEPLPQAIDGRITLTALEDRNVLTIVSTQDDTTDGVGVHKAVDPADGEVYAWTDLAPDYARFVWACFDQPDLKAPHAFTVRAPSSWLVLTNCGDPQVEDDGTHKTWTVPATPPLATYNTVINAGPYHQIRREAAGHDLGVFARQSLRAVLERDADEIFTLTSQGLEFFESKFGMAFPQRKYDQVFAPEFGGAMENYGCVTWMDWFLRRSTPTRAEWDLFSRYLLHELAHMWFGNIVTMRWWDDLWLNEAFADFASNWAAVSATSYTDAWAVHLVDGKPMAYLVDQGPTTHPIRQPVEDVSEAEATFDAITYTKGASVLRQLMTYVGEDVFAAGLTAYFAKHAWKNTTLQDLMDAIAENSGRDLDAWRDGWLDRAGTDRLMLEQDGNGFALVAKDPRPQVLAVGTYSRREDRLERTDRALVEVSGDRTRIVLGRQADLYLVNDDDLTFASTRPDRGTRDAFFDNARDLPSTMSRGVAVATAWDMLINGEATAAEVVRCLTGVLATESSESVIEPYLDRAADVADRWSPPAERNALLRKVAATCRTIQGKAALRGLARTAADLDEVGWLQAEAGDDLDLQWRALVRKAQLGGETAADVKALLERDPDPDAWISELTVRAAIPDAAEKLTVWERLRTVPFASVHQVAAAFWSAGQDDLLTPFAQAFLDLAPSLHTGGMAPARSYTRHLFPLFGVDTAFVKAAKALAPQTVPIVRNNLLERADLLSRMLRTRQR